MGFFNFNRAPKPNTAEQDKEETVQAFVSFLEKQNKIDIFDNLLDSYNDACIEKNEDTRQAVISLMEDVLVDANIVLPEDMNVIQMFSAVHENNSGGKGRNILPLINAANLSDLPARAEHKPMVLKQEQRVGEGVDPEVLIKKMNDEGNTPAPSAQRAGFVNDIVDVSPHQIRTPAEEEAFFRQGQNPFNLPNAK